MNKKVDIISQSPLGIIPCDKDPDIYNVYSNTTEHRIVDMLIFECTCPNKHKLFCSHLRAVLKKFGTRYDSEVADIYSILNDVNLKNSFASCIDKADNHYKLFLKSLSYHFKLNGLGAIDDFTSEIPRKHMRVLNAALKSLSSISWRFYLLKKKDNSLIKSIYYASNLRNAIKVDALLESLDSSLSTIKREDYSTVVEFLQAIESNSLEEIQVFNPTSIINIFTSILCKTVISSENKKVLMDSIVEFFHYNKFDLSFDKGKTKSKLIGLNSIFFHMIFKTIKKYLNYIDARFINESINLILMEEFGLNLNLLGIDDEIIAQETSLKENNVKIKTGVVDLLSFKIERIDSLTSNYISSDKIDFFEDNNLVNIICSAPILVDLYDYLFWYSAGNQVKYGDLSEFLENNIDKKVFSHFFFVKFSKNGNKSILSDSRLANNQICIYKIVKPNNETYSATHIYYSLMVDSIYKCDGIKTLNYFIGGCIQENGIYKFIKIFPKEVLITDISSLDQNTFDLLNFFLCISKACPPIIYVDLWDYLLTSISFVFEIEKEQLIISLSDYFMKNEGLLELNKLFYVIPVQMKRDFYTKIYNCSSSDSNSIENEVCNQDSKEKYNIPHKLHSDNEPSSEELGCGHCLDNKPNNKMDCRDFIMSIQKQRFGISDKTHDNTGFNLIIKNYNRIINQSCRNLSIKLYTKINHFIFELMQNADDNLYCSCIGNIPSIIFVFHKTGVLVINNEIGFTEKDVSSICDIGNSSKISDEKTIGCFGIGFKSVFSITNTPYIFSNGYNFMFNLDSKHGSYIFPEWVDNNLSDLIPFHKYQNEYDTEISIYKTKFWLPYKENVNLDVKINDNIILFTNKIKRIKLITNNKVLQIKRNDIFLSNDILLSNITRDILHDNFSNKKQKISLSKVNTKSFLIVNYRFQVPKNISNLVKSRKSNILAIGIEINNDELDSYDGECNSDNKDVFSFLPIKPFGLKFIIQADFDLTSSRESISIDSSWNIYLREIIPNAIIHMITRIREINGFHSLKKTLLNIMPTKMDTIDEFFLPVISRLNQALMYERCIFTFEKTFTQPSNSVYINKSSKTYELLSRIFPNINEFSYLLYKYSNKYLIYNIFINSRNVLFEDLGISEFNIEMLIDILIGITSDYSYFDRSFEWYFNLFLLIDGLMNTSTNINSSLQKLQTLPLFLTEEYLYKGSINSSSLKNQLFYIDEDFPSISKLGIYFINKNFILQLKEFYKEQNFNYNRIMNLIQSLGITTLKSEFYYELIEESLATTTLDIDNHIYFTFLLAKSNFSSQNKNQIYAVNSDNEFLPLTASNFHLLCSNEKYSIVESISKIIDNKDSMKNLSYNKFNDKYLLHSDESFWNSYFRKFGITIMPFYFEQIEFNKLSDYIEYLESSSKLNNNKLVEQHIESINNISDYSSQTSITDFYCHGIDSLATLMNQTLLNNIGNRYYEEIVSIISNQIINCVCDFWDDIKKYWSTKTSKATNIPSFVKTQFSTYPIFISRYLFKRKFIFKQLCSPKHLTLFTETRDEIISKFVNFLVLDNQKETTPNILFDAFSSIIKIDLEYLCLLIEALYNESKDEKISLHSRQIDETSCIELLEIIILESKQNYSINLGNILKKNMLIPILEENKYNWKKIEELFWTDDNNILPKSHSLLYQFSKIHKLNISIDDIKRFFIHLGVSIKPENKHLIAYLSDLYKIENIDLDSRILYTYINIINKLYKTEAKILNFIQLPIIIKKRCRWLRYDSIIMNCDNYAFSDSILFHYFIYKKLYTKKNVIWSPLYLLFSQSNIFENENLDIITLARDWNGICSQILAKKLEILNSFDILPVDSSSISDFYYEIIINFFGPLYEESIKDKIKARKKWNELILKGDIILLSSNISINCKGKVISLPSIFDNTANKLYVKSQDKLKNDDVEQVILSIFTYICSFFPEYYPNSKSLRAAITIFNDIVKEFELKKKIKWKELIINLVQKLESKQFKIDLKYFLLSDYVGDYFQTSIDVQIVEEVVEEIQPDYINNHCPKRIILDIGKKGEELAYEYIRTVYAVNMGLINFKITWLNQIEESGLPYDILLLPLDDNNEIEEEIYIEVKSSSKKDRNCFYITFNEWKYAERLQDNYWIFHIPGVNLNIPSLDVSDIEYKIIRNPYDSWRSGGLKMILSRN